jgi:putative nucleotidyltransferase with HDIG domain
LLSDETITIHHMVAAVVTILDARDPYTFEHSWRVAALCQRMAEKMDISPIWVETIHIAAHLHDIGKVGVPDYVLNKPGGLLAYEYELMKTHSEVGHSIVRKLPVLEDISLYILHHHERWDGKGYPAGLEGTDIPLGARIIAVADTFDAVTSRRPYRESRSVEEALSEIDRVSGSQLCPEVCGVFLDLSTELPGILSSVNREITAAEGRKEGSTQLW